MSRAPEKYFHQLYVISQGGKPVLATEGIKTVLQVRRALAATARKWQPINPPVVTVDRRVAPPGLEAGPLAIRGAFWPAEFNVPVSARLNGVEITWGWAPSKAAAQWVSSALAEVPLSFRGVKIPWSAYDASRW